MAAALGITALTLRFGGVTALRDIELALVPGEVLGLIGPNGSGKTSLLDVLSGHHAPAAGSVRLDGEEIAGLAPRRIAALGVARTFQSLRLLRRLSLYENLRAARHARAPRAELLWQSPAARRRERDELMALLALFALADRAGDTPDTLTLVAMRQLEIARALAAAPRLVLLDEPAAGTTPAETDRIAAMIVEHVLPGRSAIVIEHKMSLVTALCPRIAVLDAGCKIADGPAASVLGTGEVRRSYFGAAACGASACRGVAPCRGDDTVPGGGAAPESGTAPRGGSVLEIDALAVRHGRIRALENVSLSLAMGEVLAVAGLDGAGKSSLVRAICGLTPPAAGRIRLDGRDVTARPLHRLEGVALVPEGRVLAPSLSVAETLRLGAAHASGRVLAARRSTVLDRFPELARRLGQRAGTLSGGEATLLALARALMAAPRILLLDEPTLGLSPAATERVFETLAALRRDGLALLLVEQDLHRALELADRVLLLRHGRVVRQGRTASMPGARALEALLIGDGHHGEIAC